MFTLLDVDRHPVQMHSQTLPRTFDPPIFFHPTARLCSKQQKHQPTLLMTEDAWNYLRDPDMTHDGAFGSDYCEISKADMKERFVDATVGPHLVRWVVVWKFPGDLNRLPGRPFRRIVNVPLPVGEYPLKDDGWTGTQRYQHPCFPKNALVEKMRTDVPSGESVHYLEDRIGVKVAMIGSHYFIRDLWEVSPKEKQSVVEMMKELSSAVGIDCFPCYGQHHAIVLYVDRRDGTLITPRDLATLLQTTQLLRVLHRYSYYDMTAWASNVIRLAPSLLHTSSGSSSPKTHSQPHPTGSLLRRRATVDSPYVSQVPVPNGVSVAVVAEEGDFVLIRYHAMQGWVRAKYLS